MRYKLDVDGFVISVAFGCYLEGSTEYEGEVPCGYNSLDDWATYSCIQAYYIDANGNLMLDLDRLAKCRRKEAQERVDNAPLLRKDLYGSETVLDSQYKKGTANGELIELEDIQTIAPKVVLAGIQPYEYKKLHIFTQCKNLMPNDAITEEVYGVKFTRRTDDSISVHGTPTENGEYTIAGSSTNTVPLFSLKKNQPYYVNLGGMYCEFRYFDGETTQQKYAGASGLINLDEAIEVTHVVIKTDTLDDGYNCTFFPQIEWGASFTGYETHKSKIFEIDFSEFVVERGLYPSNELLPSNTLYPNDERYWTVTDIESITVENGIVTAIIDGVEQVIGYGNVGLFSDYNLIYTSKDSVGMVMEYSTNVYDVDSLEFLQGKETTTKKFKILDDGSIEAHNGYFSGKIEADEGYFKGEIVSNSATITGGSFKVNKSDFDFGVFTLESNDYLVNFTSDELEVFDKTNLKVATFGVFGVSLGTYTGVPHTNNFSKTYARSYYKDNAYVKGTLYTASGTVSQSDEATKYDIAELEKEKTADFIYSLKPKQFKFINGTSGRNHHGFIAQEVKESMVGDWGLYVDSNPEEEGNKALRYEELIADLVATVQTQNERIKQLEERVGAKNE
jgi:hypothetical protein